MSDEWAIEGLTEQEGDDFMAAISGAPVTTTAPATLANALAAALRSPECGHHETVADCWDADAYRDEADRLAAILTAPGGWLDSLAGDEAVVEAVDTAIDEAITDGCLFDPLGKTALTALAAALRSNP